jgi:mannose-1-phosphate guanylyltransferase / phosphomannomutase
MAGGEGSRLRPLTSNQPKPMLPILGRPMMERVLGLAASHGITEAVATVHFLGSVVRNYFGDGSDLGLSLEYTAEEEPLGTAGSVRNARALLGDRFVVLSGDSLTDLDLSDMVQFHTNKGAAVTVALKKADDPLEFGIVITDEGGRVERFLEKPGWGDVFSDTVNTGIYVLEAEVLDLVPEGEAFDFSKDLFPLLLEKGYPIYGYVTDRFWTDVGTIDAYLAAHRAALDREVNIDIEGFEIESGIWLGEGGEINPDVELRAPLYVGPDSRVEGGATLRAYTVLGRGVTVKAGAFLDRAIVDDYAYVGASASLRGCVLGRNSDVRFGARLDEGVVVANSCHVGEAAVLNPQVKVYPFKTVDPGAIVSESIIWQSSGPRALFGDRGVAGLINIDITPEMAIRLALAYASLLPKGSTVVTCRDVTRPARIVKRAMVAGINSAGLDCHDLELVPEPLARFYARSARAVGGFAVRSAPFDAASLEIQFFDENGIDVPPRMQRQLERSFYRDDLRRAFHHEIGELNFPARAREYYLRGLLDAVDIDIIRARHPKLVIDYAFGGTTFTGPRVMGRLGGEVLAVNAVLDEERAVLPKREFEERLADLARLVRSSGSELAARFDSSGDRLYLIDGAGRILRGRTALLAFVWLVSEAVPEPRVALPVATSRVAEQLVRSKGGEVQWTATTPAALMEAAVRGQVAFAGDENGGFVFPDFLSARDGVLALAKLLELLAKTGLSLRQVVDRLPPTHVVRREVATPWESKGTVMRRLLERMNGERLVTIDGVKAYRGEDWALVVPHPQEPVVRVWAESSTPEAASALAAEFVSLVEEMRP